MVASFHQLILLLLCLSFSLVDYISPFVHAKKQLHKSHNHVHGIGRDKDAPTYMTVSAVENSRNMDLISRDIDYRIFRDGDNNLWREVKMSASYFMFEDFAIRPFWHTSVFIADDDYYDDYPASGARGWDLSMNESGGHFLRLEYDVLPKSNRSPKDRKEYSHLRFHSICFTRYTDDEIKAYITRFRGKYHFLGRNCVHYVEYLLNFLCTPELSKKYVNKYKLPIMKYGRYFRKLSEKLGLKHNKQLKWNFTEIQVNETRRALRKEHYLRVYLGEKSQAADKPDVHPWWKFWKWDLWKSFRNLV